MVMRMKPASFTSVSPVPVNHAYTDNHEDSQTVHEGVQITCVTLFTWELDTLVHGLDVQPEPFS